MLRKRIYKTPPRQRHLAMLRKRLQRARARARSCKPGSKKIDRVLVLKAYMRSSFEDAVFEQTDFAGFVLDDDRGDPEWRPLLAEIIVLLAAFGLRHKPKLSVTRDPKTGVLQVVSENGNLVESTRV
jgi:hypothetical protein